MIKAGIYGPSDLHSPLRKQLLRLLLRHPDVDLHTVACAGATGIPLAELHPVYSGETDLRLEPTPDLSNLDVLFVIDEANLTDDIRARVDSDKELRLIVLGNAETLRSQPLENMVYGFCEYNRKALVRGATTAVSPSPEALLVETALFPLAKNWLLPAGTIKGTLTGTYSSDTSEAVAMLKVIQSSFEARISLIPADIAPYDRMDLTLEVPLTDETHRIREIYEEAYSDHGFVYLVPSHVDIESEDLRGSNKCLLKIIPSQTGVTVKASADYMTRGNAGNGVHLMNLLFGLHERTGLSI